VLAQVGKHRVDLFVRGDIAIKHARLSAELAGQIYGTLPDALTLAREGQFGAFAVGCDSDAVCNRTIR
jgi:hypothetical protein